MITFKNTSNLRSNCNINVFHKQINIKANCRERENETNLRGRRRMKTLSLKALGRFPFDLKIFTVKKTYVFSNNFFLRYGIVLKIPPIESYAFSGSKLYPKKIQLQKKFPTKKKISENKKN